MGNVDSARCHAKGNIDSGPPVAISTSYPLVRCFDNLVYSDVYGSWMGLLTSLYTDMS